MHTNVNLVQNLMMQNVDILNSYIQYLSISIENILSDVYSNWVIAKIEHTDVLITCGTFINVLNGIY